MARRTRGRTQARKGLAAASELQGLSPPQVAELLAQLKERERILLATVAKGAATPLSEPPSINRLRNQLNQLRESRPTKFRDIFFGERMTDEERLLARRIQDEEIAWRATLDAAGATVEQARSGLAKVRASIRAAQAARRAHTLERMRAQAAAYLGDARAPADDLRRKSARPERCPYCEQPSADWQLDHIHPVSKGGLSIESNCVMVCTECNRTKGTQLLRPFCRSRNLNYEAVVMRLELMGKDV